MRLWQTTAAPRQLTKSMIATFSASPAALKREYHPRQQHQTAPPTMNIVELDPACRLNYVPNKLQPAKIDYALSNSFGFGGTDGSLVFKRWME